MTRNIALLFTTLSLPLFVLACGGTTLAGPGGDAGTSDGSPPPTGGDSGPTVISCPTMLTACSGECVDIFTDPNNCGFCGNPCGADGVCSGGLCATGVPDSGLPGNPGGPTPPSSSPDVTLAVHDYYFGDSDRNGVMSVTAWEGYGLNIDGKITTASSTDVCTLYAGAARTAQVDGLGGIDNSFGENILPILLTVAGENYSQMINDGIASGQSGTMMFALGNVGAGADYFPLAGAVFTADAPSTPPTWTGSDVWPIDSSSVNGSVMMPYATFPQSYLSNRTWVSAPSNAMADVQVEFMSGADIQVTHAQIVMTIAADNSSATNGTLAGVIGTENFITTLQAVAGRISTSLCSGSAFQSIASQIDQASDILSDGTNEVGTPCDAISIGIGFDATAAQLGAVVMPTPPPNPCSP